MFGKLKVMLKVSSFLMVASFLALMVPPALAQQNIRLQPVVRVFSPSPSPSRSEVPLPSVSPSSSGVAQLGPSPSALGYREIRCEDVYINYVIAQKVAYIYYNPGGGPISRSSYQTVTLYAPSEDKVFELLGCSRERVKSYIASSPIVYVYLGKFPNVRVRVLGEVSYTEQPYSIVRGFEVFGGDGRLYYEFLPSVSFGEIRNRNNRVVVWGRDVEGFVMGDILPRLGLTEEETRDFEDVELKPSLGRINKDLKYAVTVLRDREVEALLPLQVEPEAGVRIRNMVVLWRSDEPVGGKIEFGEREERGVLGEVRVLENSFLLLPNFGAGGKM